MEFVEIMIYKVLSLPTISNPRSLSVDHNIFALYLFALDVAGKSCINFMSVDA